MAEGMRDTLVGGGLVLGLAIGFGVEYHTNEIARLKAHTVEVCLSKMGERTVMNAADVVCVTTADGTYDGMIGADKLPEGTTTEQMQEYIVNHHVEAASIEPRRMVGWGFAGATELIWPTLIWQALDN
jgi:hypothetical protein